MSSVELLIGGLISCYAIGWGVGRWIKSIRQFFDSI